MIWSLAGVDREFSRQFPGSTTQNYLERSALPDMLLCLLVVKALQKVLTEYFPDCSSFQDPERR